MSLCSSKVPADVLPYIATAMLPGAISSISAQRILLPEGAGTALVFYERTRFEIPGEPLAHHSWFDASRASRIA